MTTQHSPTKQDLAPQEVPTRQRSDRAAFSLLEVLLSMAILVGAVAVLGELMSLGMNNVEVARDRSRAAVMADGIMDQILAGLIAAQATSETAVPEELLTYDELNDNWLYSIESAVTTDPGMTAVTVTVRRSSSDRSFDVTLADFTLTRWITDPAVMEEFAAAEDAAATAAEEEASGAEASTSSTSGTDAGGSQ